MAAIRGDIVVGIFDHVGEAQSAVADLMKQEFDSEQVAVWSGAVEPEVLTEMFGPDQETHYYEDALRVERILVIVRTPQRQEIACEVLNQHGAENIAPPSASAASGRRHKHLRPSTHGASMPAAGFTIAGNLGSSLRPHREPLEQRTFSPEAAHLEPEREVPEVTEPGWMPR